MIPGTPVCAGTRPTPACHFCLRRCPSNESLTLLSVQVPVQRVHDTPVCAGTRPTPACHFCLRRCPSNESLTLLSVQVPLQREPPVPRAPVGGGARRRVSGGLRVSGRAAGGPPRQQRRPAAVRFLRARRHGVQRLPALPPLPGQQSPHLRRLLHVGWWTYVQLIGDAVCSL